MWWEKFKTAAVHFTTIPWKPYTAHKVLAVKAIISASFVLVLALTTYRCTLGLKKSSSSGGSITPSLHHIKKKKQKKSKTVVKVAQNRVPEKKKFTVRFL